MITLENLIPKKTQLLLSLSLIISGCSSIGPHPKMYALESEVEAISEVTSILVLPTTGTGTKKKDADENLAIPGGAFRRYQNALVTQDGIARTVSTLKAPKGTTLALAAPWQTAFYQWIESYKVESKDQDDSKPKLELTTPIQPKKIATNKQVKKLIKRLTRTKKGVQAIARSIQSGNLARATKVVAKAKRATSNLEALNAHIRKRLNISYYILSHFEGSKETWEKDEPLYLYVAMVNPTTGKLRYVAITKAKKSDAPTDYTGLIKLSALNLFDDIEDVDDLEVPE